MSHQEEQDIIKGIAVCNPVDVEKDYLLYTVDYAAQKGFNHLQIIGPIHHPVKGNIDGMTLYRKYSQFNNGKNLQYIEQTMNAVNEACRKAAEHGIRTYVWHHELELPLDFAQRYSEVTNCCGDIEVTHPLVRDFLEHKIQDFFYAYPGIDGIILTLHETKIPLLKLKDQKLGKVERVTYITRILYEICRTIGKELIVRPFASVEEDYVMMTHAYESISTDMMIMDKWTQFDWSLTLPHNQFFRKIEKNPLFVEADVFGEYFGKGHLPLMLKEHIAQKFAYCDTFSPRGYVARIDREGEIPFGNVNEVNVVIAAAHLNHRDVEHEINTFFEKEYPGAAKEVKKIMEDTEAVLRKTIYTRGYYFSELSYFPRLNHCKNHFYFEMMRHHYEISSNEWFIPSHWERGSIEELLNEKKMAVCEAARLYGELCQLKGKLENDKFEELRVKFCNLQLVTGIWLVLMNVFIDYVRYFETRDEKYSTSFHKDCEILLEKNRYGIEMLGDDFYGMKGMRSNANAYLIEEFVREIRDSFQYEKEQNELIEAEQPVLDYVICGGAMEGHRLRKEVNFSDTLMVDGALCRIPGSLRGIGWCSVNAHGWFSYEIHVASNADNIILITMGSSGETLDVLVDVDDQEYKIHDTVDTAREYKISYCETEGKNKVRIRFRKIAQNTPYIFLIKVLNS